MTGDEPEYQPLIDVPLPINLDSLLERRTIEGERVEYKAGWNPERALHTICAFANDCHNLGGGYLVIGVDEQNGRPVLPPTGIDPNSVDAIQKELLNLSHHAIQPPFHPIAAPYMVGGNTVLVIWAPGGETRPYAQKGPMSGNCSGSRRACHSTIATTRLRRSMTFPAG
jgi:ATP-dependent DNA helicase RecG